MSASDALSSCSAFLGNNFFFFMTSTVDGFYDLLVSTNTRRWGVCFGR